MAYDHKSIEPKWQQFWAENKTFKALNDSEKPKYYALDMFPYPSGAGLHVGHPVGMTATDIISRKRRHQGYNVLHPMGWDAFGLPAENYAIKTGVHPATSTDQNIDNFRRQIQSLGFSYDWEREFSTTDPDYYRWSQWIFLELYKKGLAYEKEMPMNWCPSCKIVAANEEVEEGHHERCGSPVEKKNLKQWMFRITDYAERLLNDLDTATVHMVHGWEGVGDRGWFDVMSKFCVQEKINYSALNYPNSATPTYAEWKEHFKKNSKLWPQDIVIAHSLGNNFMFRYLVEENKNIDQLVLVAPVKLTDLDLLNTFFDQKFNWEKIKNLVNKITIIYSDDDEYITVPDFEFIAEKLDAEKIFLPKRGHFSPSKNPELPELMPILKSIAKDTLDWPDKIKAMQRNWIGKSEGMLFTAPVKDTDLTIQTFSAHFEAFCADTFVVIAPDHPFLPTLLEGTDTKQEVLDYSKELIKKRMARGFEEEKEPEGIFTGRYIKDPVGNGDLPIWVASFALADYGTGIVKCSAHDERDFAFAKKYGLMLKPVLMPPDPVEADKVKNLEYCYTNMAEGTLMEPAEFSGKSGPELREQIKNYLVEKGLAERQVSYKLRDWIFTRQRYWGEPIPLVFDEAGDCYPLDDSELPLVLPDTPNYEPSETGESPLAKIEEWVNVRGDITDKGTVKISDNGKIKFRRETSTMPNWAGSSWYWLRFMDPQNEQEICSQKSEDYWGPVDLYVGGAEHAVLHLLYGRFWHKVLYDLGHVSTREPFKKLVNQGLIMAEDGTKMSKSVGNVINPDDVVEQYGADTLRCYEMFMGPFDQNKAWSMSSVGGVRKFLDRVERLFDKPFDAERGDGTCETGMKPEVRRAIHATVKKVGEDIDDFRFNTAISQLMVFVNEMTAQEKLPRKTIRKFLIILSPFAPHLAEELWREKLGETETITFAPWPNYDEALLVADTITYGVQVNGKVRGQLEIAADADKDTALTAAKELENVSKWLAEGTIRKEIFVPGKIIGFVVN